MALARIFIALAALALVALLWSPIATLAIVVLALVGYGLCELIGEGGERFFIGSGTGLGHHHRLR